MHKDINIGNIQDMLLTGKSKFKTIVPYDPIFLWGASLSEISLYEPCGSGDSRSYCNIKNYFKK